MDKSATTLVTGAGGLVGSSVWQALVGNGFSDVHGVTRKDCDLINPKAVEDYFKAIRPSYVFHNAGKVYGIMGNMNHKGQSYYENNLINTNVIHSSYCSNVKKIVAMGTGAIYPFPPLSLPLKEDEIFQGRPHPSENSYAAAKRGMLSMLEAYHESYGLNYVYIISCNLFGPGDNFDTSNGHVIPSLIKKFYDAKSKGHEVFVWGDGSAQRDFLYVDDAASAQISAMQSSLCGAINIGSGTVYSINDIVEMLVDITKYSNIKWDNTKPNGQDYRAYDLSKINSIGFRPTYGIFDGLRRTWEWYCREGFEKWSPSVK